MRTFNWSVLAAVAIIGGCSDPGGDVAVPTEQKPSVQSPAQPQPPEPTATIREIGSTQDIENLFESLNYTRAAWQAGIRQIPRVYISTITPRWQQTAQELEVATKKRIFFRALAPLVLRSNEMILWERARLYTLTDGIGDLSALEAADRAWLEALARRYEVLEEDELDLTVEQLAELRKRVDIVPLSLALSQTAEESGWGTSRFAVEGNALFGQWTWGGGMKPKEQRTRTRGDHGVAAFESPLESVTSYMLNLNTHHTYESLRDRRAELRANNQPVTGNELAGTLTRYSERGGAYVDTLRSIMRVNNLAPADGAYLTAEPPIILVPAENTSS